MTKGKLETALIQTINERDLARHGLEIALLYLREGSPAKARFVLEAALRGEIPGTVEHPKERPCRIK